MILYFHATLSFALAKADGSRRFYSGGIMKEDTFGLKTCYTLFPSADSGNYAPLTLTFDDDEPLPDTSEITITDLGAGEYYIDYDAPTPLSGKRFFFAKDLYSVFTLSVSGGNGALISLKGGKSAALELTDNFNPVTAEASEVNVEGRSLISLLLENQTAEKRLYLFGFDGKPTLLFKNDVDDYFFENGKLNTVTRFADCMRHEMKVRWKADKVFAFDNFAVSALSDRRYSDEFLPFLFTEELLVGGDAEKYLNGEMRRRFADLKEFLGDFTAVLTPPEYLPQTALLCYKTCAKRFKAERFVFETENGLIKGLSKP